MRRMLRRARDRLVVILASWLEVALALRELAPVFADSFTKSIEEVEAVVSGEEKSMLSRKFVLDDMPGLVSHDAYFGPDGNRYYATWSPKWEVVPDKDVPATEFKSTAGWFLAAMLDGKAVFVIPGCRVQSWARADKAPTPEICRANIIQVMGRP